MTQPQFSSGLCSTCAHAQSCSVAGRRGSGVFECSEYEPGAAITLQDEQRATASGGDSEEKLLGLCVDCANREQCTFPKPEGGIWHCEEYAAE